MPRVVTSLLFCAIAAAQAPQPDVFGALSQAYWKAHSEGRFSDAADAREQARAYLSRVPVEDPQWVYRVQSVAQLYRNAGRAVEARKILEEALAKSAALGEAAQARIILYQNLADHWTQEQNLLKAAAYLEKAVAASQLPRPPAPVPASRGGQAMAVFGGNRAFMRMSGGFNSVPNLYQQLAEVYRQLGRPDAVAAANAKARTLITDDQALAAFYAREGMVDDAAAIYRRIAEQPGDPAQAGNAYQSLSNLYAGQDRIEDAVAVLQKGVAAVESSGRPDFRSQVTWMRQSLTGLYQRAGRLADADRLFQQILNDSKSAPDEGQHVSMLLNYASYLSSTERGAQALKLLQNYLATNPSMPNWAEGNILFALANAARSAGNTEAAETWERAGREKQRSAADALQPGPHIGERLEEAATAARTGNVDKAFTLALQAIEGAAAGLDREQAVWQLQQVAFEMTTHKAGARADQLYQRLFALLEGWSIDTLQPMTNLAEQYATFLMQQPDRSNDVPNAIERYRSALLGSHGAESGMLAQALQKEIDFQLGRANRSAAWRSVEDLLALQQAANGPTSEPYLQAVRTAANAAERLDDGSRGLPLWRQTVSIADVLYPVKDARRAEVRVAAAYALANHGQFDEAERLAVESGNPQVLEQVRAMKKQRPN